MPQKPRRAKNAPVIETPLEELLPELEPETGKRGRKSLLDAPDDLPFAPMFPCFPYAIRFIFRI